LVILEFDFGRSQTFQPAYLGTPESWECCSFYATFAVCTFSITLFRAKFFDIDRRKIQLHEPLKTVGEFTVPVKLHKDVTAHLKVVIEKEAIAE
jgi:hypothetical protein